MPSADAQPSIDPLTSHLRRLRLRLLAARVGDALLVGAIAGILSIILTLLFGLGLAMLPLFASVLVIFGLLLIVALRPTLLATAARVDRDHGLSDLVSSALLVQDRDEPWARLIGAQAEQVLATIPQPRFHRFGVRAHAATWLVSGAVVLVSVAVRPSVRADDFRADQLAQASGRANDSSRTSLAPVRGIRAREAESELRGASDRPRSESSASGSNRSRPNDGRDDARGAGRADGSNDTTHAPRTGPLTADDQSTASERTGDGATSGSGRASDRTGRGRATASGVVTANAPPRRPAPWETDAWSSQREAAHAALDAGHVPPAYRPLVQDYFDR